MVYEAEVTATDIKIRGQSVLTSGSVKVDQVHFTFSPDWDGCARTAVFLSGSKTVAVVLDETNQCYIPKEVLTTTDLSVLVGAYGVVGGNITVIPTVYGMLGKVRRGVDQTADNSPEPTPTMMQQTLAQFAADKAITAADRQRCDQDAEATAADRQAVTAAGQAITAEGARHVDAVQTAGAAQVLAVQNKGAEVIAAVDAKKTAADQSAAVAQQAAEDAALAKTQAQAAAQTAVNAKDAAVLNASQTSADLQATNTAKQDALAAKDAAEAAAQTAVNAKDAAEAAALRSQGYANKEFVDATYAAMLDDTNTTAIFKLWWPLSDDGVQTKAQRLDRWFTLLRNDKTYGAQFGSPDVSSATDGTLTDASTGETCALSTDTTQGADTLDEHRAFWWLRVNAVEADAQGHLAVKFIEIEDGYDRTGEIAPVYTLQVAPYIKKTRTDAILARQLRTMPGDGFHLWAEGKDPDGTPRAYVAHATYPAGYDANGYVTSGAGKRPIIRTSYDTGRTKIKAGREFQTQWQSHDQNWLLLMWQLRHGSLVPDGKMEGCLYYTYQYLAAAAAAGVKYVPLTSAQAANFIVGSAVSVGETGGSTNSDRNTAANYNLADCVRITKKASVVIDGVEYVAVYLDIPAAIDVTTTTRISTMPWWSGTTDAVLGRGDGSPRNNTNGQSACRCAGIEYSNGAYRIVGGSELYVYAATADGASELQVWACKEQGKESNSANADYVDTGMRFIATAAGWYYGKEMDDTYDTVFFFKSAGGNGTGSSTYLRSGIYTPAVKSGVCVPGGVGSLDSGARGGLVCVDGLSSCGNAYWTGALGLSRRCWRGELPAA